MAFLNTSWRTLAILTACCICLAGLADAQTRDGCWRNGEKYPEGSKVGGYTCVNGSWQR